MILKMRFHKVQPEKISAKAIGKYGVLRMFDPGCPEIGIFSKTPASWRLKK